MARQQLRLRPIAFSLALVGYAPAWAQEVRPDATAPKIEVIGTTPVPGIGLPKEQIPANVQSLDAAALRNQQSINLPDFMSSRLPSVTVNEVQNNPFQPDVSYRGFSATPLLGAPQGISVYQDGVRVNEPFGDVVNWDLIPQSAIATMSLIPGSNPLFGLNTLGGAISVRTKSGDTHRGTMIQGYGGSFDRRSVEFEDGKQLGDAAYFISGTHFRENGWRDFSPSEVNQLFAKLSKRTDKLSLDLSLTHGNTDLIGNGLIPESMFSQRREQIFTLPDNTRNQMTMVALNGTYWLTNDSQISGTVYHRRNKTRTLNGDANDDFEGDPALDGAVGANGGLGKNEETAVNNRTRTTQRASGFALQWGLASMQNQLAVGVTHDRSSSTFEQSSEIGIFNTARGVVPEDPTEIELENSLRGRTRTTSLFLTDTYSITPQLHVAASARYNHTQVTTQDQLNPVAPNLDGDFTYKKLNPALGLTWQAANALTVYGGYSQGSRAPSPIELGCADPNNPCTLPNALAADPFLKQVVARTIEAGLRGRLGTGLLWNVGVYRTNNYDDILFVGTTTSAGFFTNFGKTRRQGVEMGLSGREGRWEWSANYSYLRATFESSACILAENNSTRGQSADCPSPDDDLIRITAGNRIAGLPDHSLKLSLAFRATDRWTIGADLLGFSDQYVRGNENNQHQPGTVELNGETRTFFGSGKTPAYAILNLNTRYDLGGGWEIFGKINNVFDKKYFTGGALAENPFDALGVFQTNSDNWARETFLAPGAPRAGWVGVRYRFGGPASR